MAAETGAARYRTGAYAFWRAHVHALVAEAGLADPDDVLAELLLAPLAVELHQHLTARGADLDALTAALARLAERALGRP